MDENFQNGVDKSGLIEGVFRQSEDSHGGDRTVLCTLSYELSYLEARRPLSLRLPILPGSVRSTWFDIDMTLAMLSNTAELNN